MRAAKGSSGSAADADGATAPSPRGGAAAAYRRGSTAAAAGAGDARAGAEGGATATCDIGCAPTHVRSGGGSPAPFQLRKLEQPRALRGVSGGDTDASGDVGVNSGEGEAREKRARHAVDGGQLCSMCCTQQVYVPPKRSAYKCAYCVRCHKLASRVRRVTQGARGVADVREAYERMGSDADEAAVEAAAVFGVHCGPVPPSGAEAAWERMGAGPEDADVGREGGGAVAGTAAGDGGGGGEVVAGAEGQAGGVGGATVFRRWHLRRKRKRKRAQAGEEQGRGAGGVEQRTEVTCSVCLEAHVCGYRSSQTRRRYCPRCTRLTLQMARQGVNKSIPELRWLMATHGPRTADAELLALAVRSVRDGAEGPGGAGVSAAESGEVGVMGGAEGGERAGGRGERGAHRCTICGVRRQHGKRSHCKACSAVVESLQGHGSARRCRAAVRELGPDAGHAALIACARKLQVADIAEGGSSSGTDVGSDADATAGDGGPGSDGERADGWTRGPARGAPATSRAVRAAGGDVRPLRACAVCQQRLRSGAVGECERCVRLQRELACRDAPQRLDAAFRKLGAGADDGAVLEHARNAAAADAASDDATVTDSVGDSDASREVRALCTLCAARERTPHTTYCRPCDRLRSRMSGRGSVRRLRAAIAEIGPDAPWDDLIALAQTKQMEEGEQGVELSPGSPAEARQRDAPRKAEFCCSVCGQTRWRDPARLAAGRTCCQRCARVSAGMRRAGLPGHRRHIRAALAEVGVEAAAEAVVAAACAAAGNATQRRACGDAAGAGASSGQDSEHKARQPEAIAADAAVVDAEVPDAVDGDALRSAMDALGGVYSMHV